MLEHSSDNENQPLLRSEYSLNQANYENRSQNELRDPAMVAIGATPQNERRLQPYIATIAATTGALAAGCVLGWSSPAENDVVKNSGYDFNVSAEQFSWIGSLATLGGIVSCLIIGFVMDAFGRKFTMLLLIMPFSVGWAMIVWPASVIVLSIGRFCVGFAGGAFFVVAPAYIGEIATKDIRGTLGSCLQLMITAGILYVYIIGHFFQLYTYNIICMVMPLIFGAFFIWMPESPMYYIMKNRVTDAEESLKWLRGEHNDFNDELTEIQIAHELVSRNRISLISVIKKPATLRGLMISLCLLLLVQLSGINAVIFYTALIFDAARTGVESSLATIIVGIMQVAATFVASLTVDRLGRRFLLMTSASIMCVCNILLGIYFQLDEQKSPLVPYLNWLPIGSLCVYIIAFSFGCGPVPWILTAELFSIEAKAIAGSLSGATSWLVAFLVTKFFSNIQDAIGMGPTFFIFAIFAAICTIFVFTMVPETKGKSFNEIQRSLNTTATNVENNNSTTETNISKSTIDI